MIGSSGIHNDVERRVDLYRNKPQELQQRYAMSQELLDLLALQKITAEKKAVAQQMALQSGAGGPPPTIAEQREREAMQLTKQELAQQQAALLQQRQGERQERLQDVVGSGLGSLPAPNVATPQAMAAGGIVDVDEDDEDDEGYARGGAVEDLPPWFEDLLAAIQQRESANNPNAVSPAGAEGLMQVMPGTQRDPGFGVRPAADRSPEELRRVGRDYAAAMYRRYGGDLDKMLAAYNWGPGNVDKFGLDPRKLPKETRDYIPAVKAEFERRAGGRDTEGGIPSLARPGFRIRPMTDRYAQASTGTRNDASGEAFDEELSVPGPTPAELMLGGYSEAPGKSLWQSIKDLVGGSEPDLYKFDQPNLSRPAAERVYARDQAERAAKKAKEEAERAKTAPEGAELPPNAGPPESAIPRGVGVAPGGAAPAQDEAGLRALIAGQSGAAAPAELSPDARDFRTLVKGQAAEQMSRNSLAEAAAEEARARQAMAMSPEQQAARQKTLAGLEALDTSRFDPERMRQERLTRFLLGMGGRSTIGSVAQGAGAASLNYQNEMDALQRAMLGQRGSLQDKMFEDERQIREKAFGARAPVMRSVEEALRQGIQTGGTMSNTDVNAAEQAAATAATREQNRQLRADSEFARLAQARTAALTARDRKLMNVDKQFADQIGLLDMQRDAKGNLKPDMERRYRQLVLERDKLRRAVEDEYAAVERDIVVRMGGAQSSGGMDNWGQMTVR